MKYEQKHPVLVADTKRKHITETYTGFPPGISNVIAAFLTDIEIRICMINPSKNFPFQIYCRIRSTAGSLATGSKESLQLISLENPTDLICNIHPGVPPSCQFEQKHAKLCKILQQSSNQLKSAKPLFRPPKWSAETTEQRGRG